MPKIEVEGFETFEATPGRRLVLALMEHDVDVMHRCGGLAKCTTCRVQVLSGDAGEMNERERTRLAREAALEPNTRLSCQILCNNDLSVRVLQRLRDSGLTDAGPQVHEDVDSPTHA